MNKFTKYLLTGFLILSSSLAFGANATNWKTYYEDEKVKISYQKQECNFDNYFNQEFVVLKIENLSSKTISVEWDNKIWYDESCINCEQENSEFRKKIRIESRKTIEGNCSEHNALRIFSRFTENLKDMPGVDKITILTKFELENINITDE